MYALTSFLVSLIARGPLLAILSTSSQAASISLSLGTAWTARPIDTACLPVTFSQVMIMCLAQTGPTNRLSLALEPQV